MPAFPASPPVPRPIAPRARRRTVAVAATLAAALLGPAVSAQGQAIPPVAPVTAAPPAAPRDTLPPPRPVSRPAPRPAGAATTRSSSRTATPPRVSCLVLRTEPGGIVRCGRLGPVTLAGIAPRGAARRLDTALAQIVRPGMPLLVELDPRATCPGRPVAVYLYRATGAMVNADLLRRGVAIPLLRGRHAAALAARSSVPPAAGCPAPATAR